MSIDVRRFSPIFYLCVGHKIRAENNKQLFHHVDINYGRHLREHSATFFFFLSPLFSLAESELSTSTDSRDWQDRFAINSGHPTYKRMRKKCALWLNDVGNVFVSGMSNARLGKNFNCDPIPESSTEMSCGKFHSVTYWKFVKKC